ncbi:MAG: hypothetical protein QM724_07430 [Flavobacteriales bacterium]
MAGGTHVLFITYLFPPYFGIGARRWSKFARALAQRGYTVHVIHSRLPQDLNGSFWTADVQQPGIHTYELPQRYPTVLVKRTLDTFLDKVGYRFWMRAVRWLAPGNPLDKTVFWHDQLLRKAGELIGTHNIRNVVVTGAPFRLLAFGVDIKRK